MRHSHLFDPAHIDVLEAEDRKLWQDPDKILNALEIKPSFVIADLGCGSGFFTVPLAQRAKKVYAIDVQQEMLDYLEGKLNKSKIKNVELRLSEPDEIPLDNECLDLLLSVDTLHEFHDRAKMIREMFRVLIKNGRILIVDFQKRETGFGPPVSIRIAKSNATALFEDAGFSFVKAKDLQYHYLLVFAKH